MLTHRFPGRHIALLLGTAAAIASLVITIAIASPAGACIFGPWEGQVTPSSGLTTFDISPAVESQDPSAGISVGTPQRAGMLTTVVLPVRGGTVWTKSAFGTVNLGGTIVLGAARSGRTIQMNNVVVALLPRPAVTADIPGRGPVTMFTFTLGPDPDNRVYRVGPHRLVIGSSVVRLTSDGARMLNDQLGIHVFSGGGLFGTLETSAVVS